MKRVSATNSVTVAPPAVAPVGPPATMFCLLHLGNPKTKSDFCEVGCVL